MTLTAIIAAVLAALGAVAAAYFKGSQAGKNSEIVKKAQADAKLRSEYDRIDARAPDLGDAVDRLRKRSSASPE